MSKVEINQENHACIITPAITLWDTDRIGDDVIYLYVTADMDEDAPCKKFRAFRSDLEDYVTESELNIVQVDVDKFEPCDSFNYLLDNWEEVKDDYWDDVVLPKLTLAYNEANAYIQSFKAKHTSPLTTEEAVALIIRVEQLFGIQISQEAA